MDFFKNKRSHGEQYAMIFPYRSQKTSVLMNVGMDYEQQQQKALFYASEKFLQDKNNNNNNSHNVSRQTIGADSII